MSIELICSWARPHATASEVKFLDELRLKASALERDSVNVKPTSLPGIREMKPFTGEILSALRDEQTAKKVDFWQRQRAMEHDGVELVRSALQILQRAIASKDSAQKKLDEKKAELSGKLKSLGFTPSDALLASHPDIAALQKEASDLVAHEKALRSGNLTDAFQRGADQARTMANNVLHQAGFLANVA